MLWSRYLSFYVIINKLSDDRFTNAGIINECIAATPALLIIQARDAANVNRICGMDEFSVTVSSVVTRKGKDVLEAITIPLEIFDQEDGTYLVQLTYPNKGLYDVAISFNGTFRGVNNFHVSIHC